MPIKIIRVSLLLLFMVFVYCWKNRYWKIQSNFESRESYTLEIGAHRKITNSQRVVVFIPGTPWKVIIRITHACRILSQPLLQRTQNPNASASTSNMALLIVLVMYFVDDLLNALAHEYAREQ